jgi:hypothetical protein
MIDLSFVLTCILGECDDRWAIRIDPYVYHFDRTDMSDSELLAGYRADSLIPASLMPSLFSGTTAQTWAALRHKGNGPVFVKVMRRVYYRRRDIESWIEQNRKVRTDLHV